MTARIGLLLVFAAGACASASMVRSARRHADDAVRLYPTDMAGGDRALGEAKHSCGVADRAERAACDLEVQRAIAARNARLVQLQQAARAALAQSLHDSVAAAGTSQPARDAAISLCREQLQFDIMDASTRTHCDQLVDPERSARIGAFDSDANQRVAVCSELGLWQIPVTAAGSLQQQELARRCTPVLAPLVAACDSEVDRLLRIHNLRGAVHVAKSGPCSASSNMRIITASLETRAMFTSDGYDPCLSHEAVATSTGMLLTPDDAVIAAHALATLQLQCDELVARQATLARDAAAARAKLRDQPTQSGPIEENTSGYPPCPYVYQEGKKVYTTTIGCRP